MDFLRYINHLSNTDKASHDMNSDNTTFTPQSRSHTEAVIYQTEAGDHLLVLVSNIPLLPKAVGC